MVYWILNESLSALLFLLWFGINLYLFIDTFNWYEDEDAYFYTRVMLGSTLAWARASATCLNFNCLLILLPVSRNLISFLRGTSFQFINFFSSWERIPEERTNIFF